MAPVRSTAHGVRLGGATLVAAIAIVIAGCSGTARQPSTVTEAASSVQAATDVPSASATDNTAVAIRQWYNGGGERLLDDISKSLTAVTQSIDTGSNSDLRGACADLSTNVRAMRLYAAPMPDAVAEASLKSALEHLQMAGLKCTLAAWSNDRQTLDEMGTELVAGSKDVKAMTERVRQLQ